MATPQPSTAFDIELYNSIIIETEKIIDENTLFLTGERRVEIYNEVYRLVKEDQKISNNVTSLSKYTRTIHLMVA